MSDILNKSSRGGGTPVIAFVHLGQNPAPTLNWYAKLAMLNEEDFEVALITDFPKLHENFSGRVIHYERNKEFTGLLRFKQKNRAYSSVAGGYWLYSLERIFALNELTKVYGENQPIIHLESDNLGLFTNETIAFCLNRIKKTSVVRYSSDDGIASILISPKLKTLLFDLEQLNKILLNNPATRSDMSLLGEALNSGVFGELPSLPDDNWKLPEESEHYIVFDGAAIGQYLFGLDAVHTQNRQISGHINDLYPLSLNKAVWTLNNSDKYPLKISLKEKNLIPMNLHIHSKILIHRPDALDKDWMRYIKEANNLLQRTESEKIPDHIHSYKISIKNRLRLRIKRLNYTKKFTSWLGQ
jgi:hypothetical protein